MKKYLVIFLLGLFLTNTSYAGTYFFKNCDDQASDTRINSTIDLDNKAVHSRSINTTENEVMLDGKLKINK